MNELKITLTVEQAKTLLDLINYPLDGQCYHIAEKDKEFQVLTDIQRKLENILE